MLATWRNLSLTVRLSALGALVTAVAVGLSVAIMVRLVEGDMRRQAQATLEANMRLAWHQVMAAAGGGAFTVADGTMQAGPVTLNENFGLVDKVRDIIGGTATIFMGDLRITTNVEKPDGSRAIGTRLTAGPVYDAVLKEGRSFRGEAEVVGVPYFTAYDPIKGRDGTVLGILYVGVKKAEFLNVLHRLMQQGALVGGAVTMFGVAGLFLVIRRVMRRLIELGAAMTALAAGRLDGEVPGVAAAGEIGVMARAVAGFRDGLREAERLRRRAAEQERETQAERLASRRAMAEGFQRRARGQPGGSDGGGRVVEQHRRGAVGHRGAGGAAGRSRDGGGRRRRVRPWATWRRPRRN